MSSIASPTTPPPLDPARRLTDALPTHLTHFWAGQWQSAQGKDRLDAFNPSTGERLASLPVAQPAEVDAAVRAAAQSFPDWRRTPPLERARMLRLAAARIREHAAELALIDAAGCGNPVTAMLFDAEIAATQLEYFAGLVLEIKGETIPTGNGSLNYTQREPLGVVARIFPFNHPFMFAAGKIAAPLAAGNTVVIKPPEQAPLSTLRLMELLADVFPPGVLNCVLGGRDTGATLVAHPTVAAVGLIGSVQAGRAVLAATAHDMKHTLLELGGKNAMIIFPDSDFERAVAGAVRGMNFTWCGQSCGSTSRLFVHESLHDRFVQALVERVGREHRPGIATDPATTMGALASRAQYERTLDYIAVARQEGATLACGGEHPDDPALQRGWFVEPTIFTDVRPDMRIAQEEVFGPVLSVLRWEDEASLLQAVNGVDFGLTASVWTRDLATAHQIASQIQAGYIWVNDCSSHFMGAPFGGYKRSGKGREESKEELFEFTQVKNINVSVQR
ncbi:aldehyde dehydrogenase family protein [Pigmentiphaga litoralis]|uniref:aldehyde dehydrogenase family protein n=1 Tax=Pigmentiphaga litoralis TaxID=516702 RepID=UPI003899FBDE